MINAWENMHCAASGVGALHPHQAALDLCLPPLDPFDPTDELPNEIRGSFAQLMQALAGVQPQRGEDVVVASVRKMSSQQADDCAALIVEIFGALCREESLAQRPQLASIVQLRSVDRPPEEFAVPALIATN